MIHFHCPACGTTLQLPSSMGGQQGPCPRCHQDILAPNPTFGLGPRLAPQTIPLPPAPAPAREENFQPFSDSPSAPPRGQDPPVVKTAPLVKKAPASTVIHSPAPASRIPICTGPRRTILLLSCTLSALLGLGTGYLLGTNKFRLHSSFQTPAPAKPSPKLAKTVEPPPAKVEAIPAETKADTPAPPAEKPSQPAPSTVSESPKKAEPPALKVSDQAMAALKAFLEAPDWASRSVYVLDADKYRDAMEAYSHQGNDGPTGYTDIQVANSATDSITGETLFIFQVETTDMPNGIPVAVQETPKGWLVDWPTFVEFRDDRFEKFATGKEDGTGIFHLIVKTPPEGEDQAKNPYFVTYLVTPPMPNRQRPVFCKKDSDESQQLKRTTPTGSLSNLVLEVAKKTAPDEHKTPYLEIINVVSTNWRPSTP